jgi:hypothetical protein
MGYEPRWDIDLAYGTEAETEFRRILTGNVEVKHKRRRDEKFYIETRQNPFRSGWRPSGITVTQSNWYAFAPDTLDIFYVVSTARLCRGIVAQQCERREARRGECPTMGWLFSFRDLMSQALDTPPVQPWERKDQNGRAPLWVPANDRFVDREAPE